MIKLSKFMKHFKPYLFEELYRKAKLYKENGYDVINLSVGDPELGASEILKNKLIEEIKNIENDRYPNTKGNERLRKAISNWHKKRHQVNLDLDDEISVLIGSKEGIAHLPIVVMNEGDWCIIGNPTYPTYRTGVWLVKGNIFYLPLLEKNGYLPDISYIPKKVLDKTKLFFLNYPNNPTGAVMDFYYVKEIVKWAKRNNILLAFDCAYSEMYFDEPTHSVFEIDGAKSIAVEFYSVSKTYSIPGWRCGWICGNSKVVKALNTVKENIDSGQFNAIQNACAFALDNHERIVKEIRKIYKERALKFYNVLVENKWSVFKPKGTCFIWARPPKGEKSIEVCDFILRETGVLLAPGIGFGRYGEGYVRFSTTQNDELLEKSLERICKINWERL